MKSLLLSVVLVLAFSLNAAFGCTTFCLKSNGRVVFGRNYDWNIDDALIFINKRGVAKVAGGGEDPNPVRWVSRYGSVTFNQYGRENPNGGMNEVGLVVEELWLDETEYPQDKNLPTIDTQEWIQYELDTSATVDEAIANARKVRIDSEVKVHFMISDKSGSAATVEFLKGALVAHTGQDLPVQTLTNDTYAKSIAYLRVANSNKTTSQGSLDRFYRAAKRTREFEVEKRSKPDAINYAFDILNNVTQGIGSQWSIVYDQLQRKIHFRTQQKRQIRTIDTTRFDFSCSTDVKVIDVDTNDSGDITDKFVGYTRKANRDLIERSFNGTDFLKSIPGSVRDFYASYPESFPCQETTSDRVVGPRRY